jgi:uncharacterized protein YlxW (UPF0749 family)
MDLGRLRNIPSWQVTLGAALLALGFLIAPSSDRRTARACTTQERTPLLETATELQAEQDELKNRILQLRSDIGSVEGQGAGSADLVRQLNAQLEEARIAAGLIPLTGTGIVLRLEDSQAPVPPGASEADYLVGSHDIRTVVEELWLAGAEAIAVNGERVTPTTAIIDIGSSLLVNSAYLAPPYQVTALGPTDLYDRLSRSPGFVDFVRARGEGYGIRLSFAEPESVDMPAFAGTVTLRYSAHSPAADDAPPAQPADDRRRRGRAGAARRGAAPGAGRQRRVRPALVAGPDGLVANLNARNDSLRREVSSLEDELAVLNQDRSRGEESLDELQADLRRVRAYAGLDPVGGPGITITVSGPIDGSGVEELINELRNAGAEAIGAGSLRIVTGIVVTGAPGAAAIGDQRLGQVFELSAIGASDKLTGSLTRSGGVIAQLAATEPDVTVTVTPVDRVELPATTRTLVPAHGQPRL